MKIDRRPSILAELDRSPVRTRRTMDDTVGRTNERSVVQTVSDRRARGRTAGQPTRQGPARQEGNALSGGVTPPALRPSGTSGARVGTAADTPMDVPEGLRRRTSLNTILDVGMMSGSTKRRTTLTRLVLVLLAMGMFVLAAPGVFALDGEVDREASLDASATSDTAAGTTGTVTGDVDATVDETTGTAAGLAADAAADVQAEADSVTPPPYVDGVVRDLLETESGGDTGATGGLFAKQDYGPLQASPAEVAGAGVAAGAAGFGLVMLIKNVFGFAASRMMLAPLFSRIDKKHILENEAREMMFDLVSHNPGIGLMELSEATGLGWGTTVYHMGRLQDAGLVASMKHGQNRHFFKNGDPASQSKKAVAVLKNETAENVARYVMTTPGVTQAQIARELSIKPPTVTKYVKRLAEEGLVDTMPDGRTKIVQATTKLLDVMGTMTPETPQATPETPVQTPQAPACPLPA